MSSASFDEKLAKECALAFSNALDIGCVVSDKLGNNLQSYGYSCENCKICKVAKQTKEICMRSQLYGMTEAERFGGKYIYFCPMGLTCFVSPILGNDGTEAKITIGPFLMVDRQDYIICDILSQKNIDNNLIGHIISELENIPVIEPERVNNMSTLLFMAVGFMNNVSQANKMLNTQSSDSIQGQITAYIQQLKSDEEPPTYPFDTERALLRAISQSDKPQAQKLLNELFGHIFFSASGDFAQAKSRIYELLVLISRTAITAGADPTSTLALSHTYLHDLPRLQNIDALCFWLTKVTDNFMDTVFNYMDVKHANIIHKATHYINSHYAEKITVDDMAKMVYLSPSYFSRIFKEEQKMLFSEYLNHVRIERSKDLLLHSNIRLTDIALQVGFEDQSYYTKVFKKIVGCAPLMYRNAKGLQANNA